MTEHKITITWRRSAQVFTDNRYSRAHIWAFDGGVEVPASASPQVVPLPYSDPAAVDPEEAFIAALSSCHMLWFLSIAASRGFCVDSYTDAATGTLGKDAAGRTAITRVILRPHAIFSGHPLPAQTEVADMHHEAHAQCFIANSVKTEIRCIPTFVTERDSHAQ